MKIDITFCLLILAFAAAGLYTFTVFTAGRVYGRGEVIDRMAVSAEVSK